MNQSKIKSLLAIALFITISAATAQVGNLGNQALSNINYNPPQQQMSNVYIVTNTGNKFVNINNAKESNRVNDDNNDNNPTQINEAPQQMQTQAAQVDEPVEPTLDNGFHIRFKIDMPAVADKQTSSAHTVSYKSSKSKAATHTSFKMKRRFKHLLPHGKGKYKTSLCYNF